MLSQLHIKNFAIIKQVELEFTHGFTVVTGETGVGKSIVIDALGLCLGNRAEINMIRTGTNKAEISARFDLKYNSEAITWLKEQELFDEELKHECLIRRIISTEGKSKAYINGSLVTINQLKELTSYLIKIYGQHNQQLLLKANYQLDLLDNFLQQQTLRAQMHKAYDTWLAAKQIQQTAELDFNAQKIKLDLLNYQVNELQEAGISADEYQQLEQRYKRLNNIEQILNYSNQLQLILTDDTHANLQNLLYQAQKQLELLIKIDENYQQLATYFDNALIQIEEAVHDFQQLTANVDNNPEELAKISQRLDLINRLANKHKIQPEQLYDYQQQLFTELENLNNSEIYLAELTQHVEATKQQALLIADKLHKLRITGAKKFSQQVTATIQQLAMPYAQLQIQIQAIPDNLGVTGYDKISFNLRSNLGQEADELAKIASGGELSRICLAIQTVANIQDNIGTIIFDEIDAGISGATATIVGQLLQQLGTHNQIISVTHLPQVACYGDQQLKVDKQTTANETETIVYSLNQQQRIEAIATLLGSKELSTKALANAEEMLSLAQRSKT